jgi:hypothetical protein
MGAYSAQVLADGASHYWRLGEPSGTVAADSIAGGANAPGTISGGVTLGAAGPLADGSTAMTFDGATGQIVTALPVTTPLLVTIEAWFRTTNLARESIFSNIIGGSADSPVRLSTANGFLSVEGYGVVISDGVAVVNDNLWHHGVVTLTGTTAALYVDGTLDKSLAATRTGAGAHPGVVGSSAWDPRVFSGTLAEVAVYPLALTPAQIAAHYALRTATGGGGSAPPLPWPLALAIGLAD